MKTLNFVVGVASKDSLETCVSVTGAQETERLNQTGCRYGAANTANVPSFSWRHTGKVEVGTRLGQSLAGGGELGVIKRL